MYVDIRFEGLLSATYATAIDATTALQVSGGSVALAALGSKIPSQTRQATIIANPFNSTKNLFVGTDNTVTSAGANSFETIAPGQSKVFACNGSFPLWVIASGATGGLLTVLEVQ